MKTCSTFALMLVALFASFSITAQPLSVQFQREWGDGHMVATGGNSGRIEYATDGKGNPDFLVEPMKCNDFRRKTIYFEIKVNKMQNFSGFELRLGDVDFKNYYAHSIPSFTDPEFNIIQDGHWQRYSFSLANASVVGNPQNKIKSLGIYMQDNGKGPLQVALRNLKIQQAPSTGYVSLTFDDGYLDHIRAAKIMHKYNFPGTAYIMPRQVGEPGYLSLKQVKELQTKYHWGISSHHAIPYTDFKPDELIKEIKYTLNYLSHNGFPLSAPHLAYPLGKQNRDVVLPSVSRFFETARVAGGGVESLPPADPHLLRTVNVLDTTTPEELIDVVKNAVNNGQWAILMFHYLVDKPATEIEYRMKDFEKFIELLAKANVTVLPVDEVYRKTQLTRSAQF